MKTSLVTFFLMVAATLTGLAGGISGKVTSNGRAKSGTTITVDVGGQKTTVKSGKDGTFLVTVPASAYGSKAKVYANGTYITKCTIPSSGNYAIVNVKFK